MCRASLRAAARVGRKRRSVTSVPEEWPSPPPAVTPGDGTEPGLYAVWHNRSTVGALADQIGISAVSGGQPCGLRNSQLRVEADRVASPIVWSTRSISRS